MSNVDFSCCLLALSLCCTCQHPRFKGTQRKAVGSQSTDLVTFQKEHDQNISLLQVRSKDA